MISLPIIMDDTDENFVSYTITDCIGQFFESEENIPALLSKESEFIILQEVFTPTPGKGIGSKLMEKFLGQVSTENIRYVLLNACPMLHGYLQKDELISFYRKFRAVVLEDQGPGAIMYIDLGVTSNRLDRRMFRGPWIG